MRRPPSTNPRVLICTAYRRFPGDYLDYVGENVYLTPRVAMRRMNSPALRFLKRNVPDIEICEYPTWRQYLVRLKEGWDVVGFTFFQNEIAEVIRMAEEARRQGVAEIWAGGYGALDEGVPGFADRIFTGAAEDEVARVFGRRAQDVAHPVMVWPICFVPGNIPYMNVGVLYTQHGCPFKCTFCQTPVYDSKQFGINLESIDEVLAYHEKNGVTDIFILDELFGFNPRHAEEVTRLLVKHRMRWWAQSRAAIFLKKLDLWHERGLRFPLVGVETMNQKAADAVNKRQKVAEVREFIRRTGEKPGMYRMAYYMIGYEHLDARDTWEDVKKVKEVEFDAYQVNIITPFPKTPLWHETEERYGIFDRIYRHYDAKYLVWNHPHITPRQMQYLRNSTIRYLNQPADIYLKQFTRLIRQRIAHEKLRFVWRDVIRSPVMANFKDPRRMPVSPAPNGTKKGSKTVRPSAKQANRAATPPPA